MRILSNFKDYYDFIAGHDADPRKVFIRNNHIHRLNDGYEKLDKLVSKRINKINQFDKANIDIFLGHVWFCDKLYYYLHDIKNNIFYYDYNTINENLLKEIDKYNRQFKYPYSWINIKKHFNIKDKKESKWRIRFDTENKIENLNTLNNSPIIFSRLRIMDKDTGFGLEEVVVNGNLNEIGFNKVKSPQEAFTEIYNFIPYNEPEMPSNPTDMIRFEGKGFDSKLSFRHPYK